MEEMDNNSNWKNVPKSDRLQVISIPRKNIFPQSDWDVEPNLQEFMMVV